MKQKTHYKKIVDLENFYFMENKYQVQKRLEHYAKSNKKLISDPLFNSQIHSVCNQPTH